MFYVHGSDGIHFKGKLNGLGRIHKSRENRALLPLKTSDRHFKYIDNNHAAGIGAYNNILQQEEIIEPLVHIHQIMSSPVITIYGNESLLEGWWSLQQEKVQQLVVTTEKREVIGLLSRKDIMKYINIMDDQVQIDQEIRIVDIINSEIVSTDTSSDIREVARVMANLHIDAIPVLDKKQLIGIVTRGDILRGFAENPRVNLWA